MVSDPIWDWIGNDKLNNQYEIRGIVQFSIHMCLNEIVKRV